MQVSYCTDCRRVDHGREGPDRTDRSSIWALFAGIIYRGAQYINQRLLLSRIAFQNNSPMARATKYRSVL